MDNLIIIRKNLSFSRKAIGGFWIIIGIALLIFDKGSLGKVDWGRSIAYFIIGVIFFTPLMGSARSQIEICERCLKIIWITWYRKVTVLDSEIEGITLTAKGILIKRKDKRPLKISFYLIEKEQRVQVYKFFIEYAQLKNLVLEK
jgi:hypothetical protein